ncbi:MAG: hypothetical protein ACE5HP_07055 [Gemmatimonadota bacterium]
MSNGRETAGRRRGHRGAALIAAAAALALTGCRSTLPIGRLLDDPYHFDGRAVRVEGEVVGSVGALGYGTYKVDDGTGSLVVVSEGRGAPREGAWVRVDGRFEALLTIGRTSVAGLVEKRRRPRDRH